MLLLASIAFAADPDDTRVLAYNEGRLELPTTDPEAVFVGRVAGVCGPLPAELPAGFEAQWIHTRIPRGMPPATTYTALTQDRCHVVRGLLFLEDAGLVVDCRVLDATEAASRYAALRAAWGAGFDTEPITASPHAGSRSVVIRWTGGACEASEGRDRRVLDQPRFAAARDAIAAP